MLSVLLWYAAFGALHETAHLIAASVLLRDGCCDSMNGCATSDAYEALNSRNLFRAMLGRHVVFDAREGCFHWRANADVDNGFLQPLSPTQGHDDRMRLVRHAGWLASVSFAVIVLLIMSWRFPPRDENGDDGCAKCKPPSSSSPRFSSSEASSSRSRRRRSWWLEGVEIAVLATALEALQTDLLLPSRRFYRQTMFESSQDDCDSDRTTTAARSAILFCGNFGIILVNLAWSTSGGGAQDALDILEKMIEVTMMRGAQSGGVVTYNDGGDADAMSGDAVDVTRAGRGGKGLRSVRVRVVNGKRTDLSKLVRGKLQRAVAGVRQSPRLRQFFAGHTRFATSSKSTLDGTHPHRWSPAKVLPVYDRYGEEMRYFSGRSSPLISPSPPNPLAFICRNALFFFFFFSPSKLFSSLFSRGEFPYLST